MQLEMSEAMKVNQFHSQLRKDAMQTFRNIKPNSKGTLEDVLIKFPRWYVRPQMQITAKHQSHKPNFDPKTLSLSSFIEELNQCAERNFGTLAHKMIDSLIYAKMPPHLKNSINVAFLENGTYDQIVAHLEKELQLSGFETDGELSLPTLTTTTTVNKQNQP